MAARGSKRRSLKGGFVKQKRTWCERVGPRSYNLPRRRGGDIRPPTRHPSPSCPRCLDPPPEPSPFTPPPRLRSVPVHKTHRAHSLFTLDPPSEPSLYTPPPRLRSVLVHKTNRAHSLFTLDPKSEPSLYTPRLCGALNRLFLVLKPFVRHHQENAHFASGKRLLKSTRERM